MSSTIVNKWVSCTKPGIKYESELAISTPISVCLSCKVPCSSAGAALAQYLDKKTEEPVSNPRLQTPRFSRVSREKLCPLNLQKECWANRRFCTKNDNCPTRRFSPNAKLFRVIELKGDKKMYAIKLKSEEKMVFKNKKELNPFLGTLDPKNLDRVFEVTHVVEATMELLPNSQEGTDKKKQVRDIVDQYGGDVLTLEGKRTKLSTWANTAGEGDNTFIMGDELKPQLKLKVIGIDSYIKKNKVTPKTSASKTPPKTTEMKK